MKPQTNSSFSTHKVIAVVLLTVAAAVSTAHAAYTKIDDFESYATGNVNGKGNWHSVGTVANSQVVADPLNGANKCLNVNAAWSGCYNTLAGPIPANSTATIFFRGNFPGQFVGNSIAGLSKNNPPSGMTSGDTDLTAGLEYNGYNTKYVGAYNHTTFNQLFNSNGMWFKYWIVVNTTANTYAIYTNTAGPAVASGYAFQNGGTGTALPSFLVGGQGSNGSGNNYVDDVYIDYSGDNHATDPLSAPTVPPAPGGLTVSGCSSQAALTWSASTGATGYSVKRSTTASNETNYATTASTVYTDTVVTVGNTYYYVVTATNTAGVSSNSVEVSATIQAGNAPTMTLQPTNLLVCAGATASFTSTASGSPSVQWQVSMDNGTNWSSIGGAISTTYSFATASGDNGKQYRAQFTSPCGSVNSSAAALTVNSAPAIGTQPSSKTVCNGGAATFSVAATGGNLTYQWRKHTSTIGNATNSSYTISLVSTNDADSYDCVVSGSCPPSVTTTTVTLTVNMNCTPWQLLDNFDGYTANQTIIGQTGDNRDTGGGWTVSGGGNTSFNVTTVDTGVLDYDGAWVTAYKKLDRSASGYANLSIPANSSATVFFRFRRPADGCNDWQAGLSSSATPGTWDGTASPYAIRLTVNSCAGTWPLLANGTTLFNTANGTWYEVWLALNTGTGKYDVYVKGGSYATQTQVASQVSFTAGALQSFVVSGGGSDTGSHNYIDDIYVDLTGQDFTDPWAATQPPLTPTNLTASRTGGTATLSWSNVPYATGYYIKRATTSGSETPIGSTNATASIDAGLAIGFTYYYVVSATNAYGESPNSSEVSLTYAAPPTVATLAASGIQATAAALGAQVTYTGGENPVVTIYYGTSDGGSNAAGWANNTSLGPQSGSAAATVTGLTPATTYYFRAYAANSGGSAWASSSATFTTVTPQLAIVTNLPASGIGTSTATLNGNVINNGNDSPSITIFYGLANGGTNPGAWANSVAAGVQSGLFSAPVSGLTSNTTYYFTARAVNYAGTSWAAPSHMFSTLASNPLPPLAQGTVGLNIAGSNLDDDFVGATAKPTPYMLADGFDHWTDFGGTSGTTTLYPDSNGFSSVAATINAGGQYTTGNDHSSNGTVRLYRTYLDDHGGSKSVKLTGLNAWMAANGAGRYQVRIYSAADTGSSFIDATITDGSGNPLESVAIPVYGDMCWPGSSPCGWSGGIRGYGDSSAFLTADQITISLPGDQPPKRANLAALKITPLGPLTTPGTPMLSAISGDSLVNLTWGPVDQATSYNVKVSSTPGGPYTLLIDTSKTQFTHVGLVNGSTYYYVVSAVNSVGESPNSNEAIGAPRIAPTGLRAVATSSTIGLTWNSLPGASSYNVKRSLISGGPYSILSTGVLTTNYVDSAVGGTNRFYYIVSAQMSFGESGNSAETSARLPVAPYQVYMDTLSLATMQQDYGSPQVNANVDGGSLKLGGTTYARGVGTHANSFYVLNLRGDTTHFNATVGKDANITGGTVRFYVIGDGVVLFQSSALNDANPSAVINVDLTGVQQVALVVDDNGDGISGDHADWCSAYFTVVGDPPQPVSNDPDPQQLGILTPAAPTAPTLTFAKRFGVRPNSPVLFTLAALGNRPMTFGATGLPAGVNLDESSGRLSGSTSATGTYNVVVSASNAVGTVTGNFQLVVATNAVALTPPMGWSSWNVWGSLVDQGKVQSNADALVGNGLDQYGYSLVNIDDTWAGTRVGQPSTALQPDGTKFPNMANLSAHIHSMGLKIGLYSSPWEVTYGSRPGESADNADGSGTSLGHAYGPHFFGSNDAAYWTSNWGLDYLKYDWTPIDAASTQPMSSALRAQNRDVVLALANSAPIWNASGFTPLANMWRTLSDVYDTWDSMRLAFGTAAWQPYQSPGHWNDFDMLTVGITGNGFFYRVSGQPAGTDVKGPSRLAANEQYTQLGFWSLAGTPLILGCDLTQLDAFTKNLIANYEVIAIDQDILGNFATRIAPTALALARQQEKWFKPLADGTVAVGLFNLNSAIEQDITINWSDLGINGPQIVRDAWRQQDLGVFDGSYTTHVLIHSGALLKITPVGAVTAPTTNFSADKTSGSSPLGVVFTDNSTGTITQRSWNFGDGMTLNTTVTSVPHTYTSNGTFTVTLTVSGPAGSNTMTRASYITVGGGPVPTPYQTWQVQYFGCTNCPQADPTADPLGKGMNNMSQFLAGLNPTNPASVFQIISVVPQGNDIVITWATAGVRTNAVQVTTGGYSTNFTDLSGNIIIPIVGDTTTNYVDQGGATNGASRFYKVRLVP